MTSTKRYFKIKQCIINKLKNLSFIQNYYVFTKTEKKKKIRNKIDI